MFEVVVPSSITVTGIGIGISPYAGGTFRLLCPQCSGELIYRDSEGSDLVCVDKGGCGKVFEKFVGIDSKKLRWGGTYSQCFFLNEGEEAATRWVKRWTGLEDVKVSIERDE